MSDKRAPHGPACPICGKPAKAEYRPFCSRRCAQIDLGRWLSDSYVLPDDTPVEPEDLMQPPGPDDRGEG